MSAFARRTVSSEPNRPPVTRQTFVDGSRAATCTSLYNVVCSVPSMVSNHLHSALEQVSDMCSMDSPCVDIRARSMDDHPVPPAVLSVACCCAGSLSDGAVVWLRATSGNVHGQQSMYYHTRTGAWFTTTQDSKMQETPLLVVHNATARAAYTPRCNSLLSRSHGHCSRGSLLCYCG